jgi:hypothetical protein
MWATVVVTFTPDCTIGIKQSPLKGVFAAGIADIF